MCDWLILEGQKLILSRCGLRWNRESDIGARQVDMIMSFLILVNNGVQMGIPIGWLTLY